MAAAMLTAQVGFGDAFATIFQPILNEHSLSAKYPQAANTLRNIASYQEVMTDLRDAIQPELDLLDSRVTAPLKEYQDLVKKVRKTVTKREHKVSTQTSSSIAPRDAIAKVAAGNARVAKCGVNGV